MAKEDKKFKVAIKEEYLKALPFGKLESRVAIATVLSYFDLSDYVSNSMQAISHRTRAFFVNAGGLNGFIVRYTFRSQLQAVLKVSKLEEVTKLQQFDIKTLYQELNCFKTATEKKKFVSTSYPVLFEFILR